MNGIIIPEKITAFCKRMASQIIGQLSFKTRKDERKEIKKSKNYE